MNTYTVSILGVIFGALVPMIVGMLWYSPILFGKKWMALVGMTDADMVTAKGSAKKAYLLSFIGALIMSYVLSLFLANLFIISIGQALYVGFFAWLGFIVPSMAGEYVYTVRPRPWSLYILHIGYQLVSALLMVAVLYFFR